MPPNRHEKAGNVTGFAHFTQTTFQETGKLYIFGYGSLIWRPNISYTRSWSGYIKGYKRRFYQGTTTHRGTPQNVTTRSFVLFAFNDDLKFILLKVLVVTIYAYALILKTVNSL